MKHQSLILLILLPFLLLSCDGTKKIIGDGGGTNTGSSKGVFVKSKTLTSVLEDAQANGKIVFVDMYTTWCAPCKVMDDEVNAYDVLAVKIKIAAASKTNDRVMILI